MHGIYTPPRKQSRDLVVRYLVHSLPAESTAQVAARIPARRVMMHVYTTQIYRSANAEWWTSDGRCRERPQNAKWLNYRGSSCTYRIWGVMTVVAVPALSGCTQLRNTCERSVKLAERGIASTTTVDESHTHHRACQPD
jgi:hypothetical protein